VSGVSTKNDDHLNDGGTTQNEIDFDTDPDFDCDEVNSQYTDAPGTHSLRR
jgi:hypothetical protein